MKLVMFTIKQESQTDQQDSKIVEYLSLTS